MLLHKSVEHDSRVRREAKALAAAGHRVTVVHLPPERHTEPFELDGFRVVCATPRSWLRRALPLRAYRIAFLAGFVGQARRVRPDVIHAHDAPMLAPALAARRLTGARLVYDSHELATGVPYRERLWSGLVRALESLAIPRAAAVVTVSDGIATRLAELYRLRGPAGVVRNVPDAGIDSGGTASMRERLGIGSAPLVLHQGALAPRRGCETLVRAMAELPEAHLVFLGDPWPGYDGVVERAAIEAGVRERVHFVPSVPVERLLSHTREADVGVSLLSDDCENHRLALPNKVFEYIAAGVPVVVSDLPELRRLVEEHGVGWTAAGDDATGLARTLADALAATNGRSPDMAQAARELRWETEQRRLLEVYERLDVAGRTAGTRALVLVRNPVSHDGRVLREARLLHELGYDVLVAGSTSVQEAATELDVGGVQVVRLTPGRLPAVLRGRGRQAMLRARGRQPATAGTPGPAPSAGAPGPAPSAGAPGPAPSAGAPGPPPSAGASSPGPPPSAGAPSRGPAAASVLRRLLVTADWYRRGTRLALRERPALVHANDYNTMWIGVVAKLLCGARLVYDSHELWPDRNRRPEWRPWLLACEALFVRLADSVITTSPAYAAVLRRRYRIPEPLVVRNVPQAPAAEPAADAPPAGRPTAVYVGAVTTGRGLETAIRVLTRLPELHLRIVGPDMRGYSHRLVQVAKEAGVADRVEVAPPVPPDRVVEEAARADVGLALIEPACLSYTLTLPNKLFEYMAAGLPVVASRLPAMRELLETTGAGVTADPLDDAQVADRIAAALEPAENRRLRAAARAAAAELTWEAESAALAGVYGDP
jgi:glycosyltransferase involved in cell wall biosynthesis